MRQATVRLLAVPVVAVFRVGGSLHHSIVARVGLALGLAILLGIGVVGGGQPASIGARPVSPILPLTQAAFTTTFSTDRGLTEPVKIGFSTAMDPDSVAASIGVEPSTPVDLAWDPTGTELTVSPRDRWPVGTFETVTVRAGAMARSGQPLLRPARAVFLTRDATRVSIFPTDVAGRGVAPSTAFLLSFSGPVDAGTVGPAIRLDPPAPGTVRLSLAADGRVRYLFVPTKPLRPDLAYRLTVAGVHDADGLPVAASSLAVRTVHAPAVIRFRPRADASGVTRGAVISVRFTEAMDRPSTARAFRVSVAGKSVAGRIRWAEADRVLVFTPARSLPAGATVSMDVGAAASNVAGVRLAAPGHGTFRTVGRVVIAGKAAPAPSSGGTGSGTPPTPPVGGSWSAVETYYLGLMNCTRTGGWVTSSGACSSPGGRNVAPLILDAGISSKVSRPYAKKIAISGDCSHFIGGNPGDRLRRAGYTSYRWAENLGCMSLSPRAMVLSTHLFFQNEKASLGGHYVNMMNPAYDRVGIGVWVSGGRVRLVIDFYHR
ncbi:MAG: Bacterial Ig-like domain [Chloroflexota bacterium]|nr:Bacterial Ig-like domain [Chloroflexota bacterium]